MTTRSVPLRAALAAALCLAATPALAISPQNPYRSFNLSGINYGSMQWERAQRQGKRVWPYSTSSSSRSLQAAGFVSAGGNSGLLIQRAAPPRRIRRR